MFFFLSPAELPGSILARAAAVPYLWSRLRQALRTSQTLFGAGLRGGEVSALTDVLDEEALRTRDSVGIGGVLFV